MVAAQAVPVPHGRERQEAWQGSWEGCPCRGDSNVLQGSIRSYRGGQWGTVMRKRKSLTVVLYVRPRKGYGVAMMLKQAGAL